MTEKEGVGGGRRKKVITKPDKEWRFLDKCQGKEIKIKLVNLTITFSIFKYQYFLQR